MPNLTSLQKITAFIKKNKLQQMKQWSKRKLYMKDGQLMRYSRDMIKQIKQILILISGNDVLKMLEGKKVY
jgi:hypothetical protein